VTVLAQHGYKGPGRLHVTLGQKYPQGPTSTRKGERPLLFSDLSART